MRKYRRIEVSAYGGRVTILSGDCSRNIFDGQPSQNEMVSLNNSDGCEAVEADSIEGQLILLEAVRCLEESLSPEALARICAELVQPAPSVTDESLQLSPHETMKEI